jgi:hypothetical protein
MEDIRTTTKNAGFAGANRLNGDARRLNRRSTGVDWEGKELERTKLP